MRIGLLSDTHSYLDPELMKLFEDRDELWHAGDFGSLEVITTLTKNKPVRGVYGNIDNKEIQDLYPVDLSWSIGGFKVYMTHIAGYPERYAARVKKKLLSQPVDLFICGHSHILKIMKDPILGHFHINPGACGQEGFHLMRTAVRFEIKDDKMIKLEVIELGQRGKIK